MSKGKWLEAQKSTRDHSVKSIKERFFACLPNGAPYRSGEFLTAPPLWASKTYQSGCCVESAGGLYSVVYNGGILSTVAPTGTALRPTIKGADGINWLYHGPVPAPRSDQSDTPVWSIATVPGSCTTRIQPVPTGFSGPIDYTPWTLGGASFAYQAGDGGGFNGVSSNASGYPTSTFVEFCTDAPILAFGKLQNGGSLTFINKPPSVNGYPLFPKFTAGLALETAYAGNTNLASVLDFSARPSKVRRIHIPYLNSVFTGVWIPPEYSIWKPTNLNSYKLHLEGDSFTQGGQSGNGSLPFPLRVAAALGCTDSSSSAVGGSGYIHKQPGITTNQLDRIPVVIAYSPDILVCGGTEWDVADVTISSERRKKAYTHYWTALLDALPNLIILSVGGRDPVGKTRFDMYEAIEAFNHPQVKYLDAYGNSGNSVQTLASQVGKGWFTGDGSMTLTGTVQGNTQLILGGDAGDSHPNIRGNELIAMRYYDAIVEAMASLN